ncbi:DUF2058 domain-containing protein [Pinirhizobacter sp.]|jgi:uncharacterized protein YaiL (DUF2058 family)|uniref:DUF2058 domain-containing protein n=1 Tax=Pinirhizobacter sp. TaxID=2950432 RepID=UPI002F3E385B
MAESLRDQLLKSGIVKQVHEEKRQQQAQAPRKPRPAGANAGKGRPDASGNAKGGQVNRGQGNRGQGNRGQGSRPEGARLPSSSEMDLARAYAIRAQAEATERRKAETEAAEQARLRKERKRKLQSLLEGKALNKPDADQVRHFTYGEKIRRIYVDAGQLVALNAGELGVVQHGGRYVLLPRAIIDEVAALAPGLVALLVRPGEYVEADDGVPDDLMW